MHLYKYQEPRLPQLNTYTGIVEGVPTIVINGMVVLPELIPKDIYDPSIDYRKLFDQMVKSSLKEAE
jgi:hypothetical protein